MTAKSLTLVPKIPPARSPEREALAERIAHLANLDRELAGLKNAIGPAQDRKYDLRRAVDVAEAAVAAAKAASAQHEVDVALGRAGSPPTPVRDARAAHVNAQDALDAAVATYDAMQIRIEELQGSRGFAHGKVRDAVTAVIRSEPNVVALVDAAREAGARFLALAKAASRVANALPPGEHFTSNLDWNDRGPSESVSLMWQAALTALEADPDAPLPIIAEV